MAAQNAGRPFRFGVVAAPQGGGDQWRRLAQRVEQLGYSTLLSPDGLQLLSPVAALAVAASVTARLRVGTFVMASPLRPPWLAAWDAHSLSVLTGGRFELGIGTGRPEVAAQVAELEGQPLSSPARRLAQVEQAIDRLRELDGDQRTPVMIAASGPKARALAAAKADIVTLAAGPLATRDEMGLLCQDLLAKAGARAANIELAMNIFVVGEDVPPWMAQFMGVDSAALRAADSLAMLRGTTQQMVDDLRRRRDAFGASYISVNSAFFEQMAPVVEQLNGR
ncbi:MAG TPA: LLM class flavin-dependent oxidoreductase [Chloroflexota bacterium]|nr:LLM class flavin-dependent oxidoreductase [Chloroflexota bacterium]